MTLTALMKAIILHWGRGSSSGDKQLETQQKSANSKCTSSPSLFLCNYWSTQYCTLVGYSNLTGSQFFIYILRTIFIFQAEQVLMNMLLFWPNFSLSLFLIHLFFYAGFYCIFILFNFPKPKSNCG